MTSFSFILRLTLILLFSTATFAQTQSPVFVSPQWVKAHQSDLKIVDLRDESSYQKYHIPNAIWINYAWLIKPQEGLELSGGPNYMAKVLSQLGIKPTDDVVIYDGMGELNSSRLYWELDMMNHKKVSLMNGGSVAWILSGGKMTQALPTIKSSNYPTPKTNQVNALTADKQEVLAAIKDPNTLLVDARSKAEYLGSPKQKRTGHIPSAILFPWQISVAAKNAFKQRSNAQLKAILKQFGLGDKKKNYIVYCHTGHRAARLFTLFTSLGYPHVKLYDGSMQEWSLHPELPLKQGKQP